MTAQEFLKETLEKWKSLFEGIELKYAYDAVTEYHIVEVKPEAIRRGNADYKKMETQLWMDFMEQYPDECLLICDPSDANDMTNVLFETKSDWRILEGKDIPDCFDYIPYDYNLVHLDNTEIGLDINDYALAA